MDEKGRAALLDFYSEVFGWTEGDNSTEKGNPLILYTGSLGQFLYLLPARDEFMVTPNMDHFGMEVSSMRRAGGDSGTGQGLPGKGRSRSCHRCRCDGHALRGQGIHAQQCVHLVLDPAVDRAPAHRTAYRLSSTQPESWPLTLAGPYAHLRYVSWTWNRW